MGHGEEHEVQLKDICSKITDGSHWSPRSVDYGVPMPSVKDMTSHGFNLETTKKISREDYKKLVKAGCKPEVNDILIAKDGSYLKHAFVWKKELEIVLLSSIAILRPDTNKVDPYFLKIFLLAPQIKDRMKNFVTGAALPRIILEDFKKFKIKIPALPVQRKIASMLSNYDDLIENNNKRIKILEEIAKMIYREWFVNFRFPGYEDLEMVYNEELGKEIPEGWEVDKIGNKFQVVLGGTPARNNPEYWNGKIPWINSSKVNEIRITKGSEKITRLGLKKSSTKIMPKRTTVIAITGATLGQVSLTEIDLCANQSVVGVYCSDKLFSGYVYYNLNHIIKSIIMNAGGGAQQHINKEIVSRTKTLVPAEEILKQFNNLVNPCLDEIANLILRNQILRKTRDMLLPRLVTGRIDISDLDIEIFENL